MSGTLDQSTWGVDIGVDRSGDLLVAANGDLSPAAGGNNLAQALRMRLFTVRGELTLHPAYGSRLNSEFVGSKNVPQFVVSAELQSEMSDIITDDSRFVAAKVTNLDQRDANTPVLTATITVADGTQFEVTGLPDPLVTEISTPLLDDATAQAFDDTTTAGLFTDQSEEDTLANADFLSQLANDLSTQ